jgi:hypothetical protein
MILEMPMSNLYELHTRGFIVWFSYKTPIAIYATINKCTFIRHNRWGCTTAKHINYIKGLYNYMEFTDDEFENFINDIF